MESYAHALFLRSLYGTREVEGDVLPPVRRRKEMESLEQLSVLYDDPYVFAKEAKKKGQKVIGVSPMHFPEELVHAAGALPVILQESTEPITDGLSHLFPNFCALTRSNVDWGVKGCLEFLDAVVVSDICLQIRMAFGIMSRRMAIPFIYMWWPLAYDAERWLASVKPRLERCKNALSEVVGRDITEQDLWNSIRVYNENRRLLRQVYGVRQAKPGILRARQMQALAMASMVMPKEEHTALLSEVLGHLEEVPAPSDAKVKLFLSGHLCHRVKPEILDVIEETGAVVVGDDLYAGYRYYAAEIPTATDPLEALALRYFRPGVPCPTRGGKEGDWAEHLVSSARESGAQGVVSLLPRYCEPHMFYYPYVKDRLLQADIPFTFVETDHEAPSLEGVRTRIQALVEAV
jgi:bcr-type benzoyl-CoA reductase subunit C